MQYRLASSVMYTQLKRSSAHRVTVSATAGPELCLSGASVRNPSWTSEKEFQAARTMKRKCSLDIQMTLFTVPYRFPPVGLPTWVRLRGLREAVKSDKRLLSELCPRHRFLPRRVSKTRCQAVSVGAGIVEMLFRAEGASDQVCSGAANCVRKGESSKSF